MLTKIHIDKGDDNGTPVIVKPFVEISQAFSPANVSIEIAQTKTVMNTFDISTDPNKKEKNKGMNLTTQDRPIDNIRNITFKGIGGEVVRLDYPNLYEVNVFEKTGDTLILKTPEKIREAIVKYLREKAGEYNTLLNEQITKRNNGYYNSLSAQFNFLGQLDPLANPNTHTYSLNSIPADFFITKMIDYLDTLEAAPEYGKKAIYGVSEADTTDEKLDMVAKLLYYQNITWPERMQQSGVIEDITEIKTSFDINQKTSYIINTYLKQGNDQGKFITPTYNSTGYEIGYINSDGEDYISANVTPTFIQQIQSAQATKKNIFVEAPENDLQKEVDSCE